MRRKRFSLASNDPSRMPTFRPMVTTFRPFAAQIPDWIPLDSYSRLGPADISWFTHAHKTTLTSPNVFFDLDWLEVGAWIQEFETVFKANGLKDLECRQCDVWLRPISSRRMILHVLTKIPKSRGDINQLDFLPMLKWCYQGKEGLLASYLEGALQANQEALDKLDKLELELAQGRADSKPDSQIRSPWHHHNYCVALQRVQREQRAAAARAQREVTSIT